MRTKIVEYHGHEWDILTSSYHTGRIGVYGWITWEVFECQGKKMAVMVETQF